MNALWQLLQFVQQRIALVALVGGIILGLLLGLAIGWWWAPVKWSNATPANLRSDFQNDYFLWAADYYANTGDLEGARAKLGAEFVEPGVLAKSLQDLADSLSGPEVARLRALADKLGTAPPPTATGGAEETGGVQLRPVAMVCGAGLLVVALVGAAVFLFIRFRGARAGTGPAGRGAVVQPGAEFSPEQRVSWEDDGQPLAQFITTYTLGDDHYDPSFSIELEDGEFMGECGVGISETIGVGTPNKVTACEVWLFDKNDIRTVTMVLMSEYAFHDGALRAKLAPKGEPLLAEVGKELVLDTKMVRVRARVVEAAYGTGNLPPNSFFERLTIDLAAWAKPGQEEPLPIADASSPVMPPTL